MGEATVDLNLAGFFSNLYGDSTGFVYLALKNTNPQAASWKQEFFQYPEQLGALCAKVEAASSKFEVYFGPALFDKKNSQKINVKTSNVFWVEFDGQIPDNLNGIPEPSIRIKSSIEGHEHWYWRSSNPIDVITVERINRNLAYKLGADISGWDANQVLRPPGTFNHKRQVNVEIIYMNGTIVSPDDFHELNEAPSPVNEIIPESIPPIEEVIMKWKFPAEAMQLFRNGVPTGSRSSGLMALAYHLAEMQMTNEEILAMLLNADQRWGKFAGRTDQVKRLLQIITICRAKYPLILTGEIQGKLQHFGFVSLLKHEVHLDWIWNGLLQEQGFFLLTGPPGVGKTQFALDMSTRMATGQMFLDREITRPRKIGFLSLEMGLADIKYFMQHQADSFTKEELDCLEENLIMFPVGEPVYLSRKDQQDKLEDMIYELKLDGLVVDSLGSTTEDELTSEKEVKRLMDFNDRIRQRHGIFTSFIHHHRKASGDNKKPNKLADVYGSQYITARPTTVFCLWDNGDPNSLQGIPLKVRLSAKPDALTLYRDKNLRYTLKKTGVSVGPKEKDETKEQEENETSKTNDTETKNRFSFG